MTIADCGSDSLHLAALNVSRLHRREQSRANDENTEKPQLTAAAAAGKGGKKGGGEEVDASAGDATAVDIVGVADDVDVVDTSLIEPVFTSPSLGLRVRHHLWEADEEARRARAAGETPSWVRHWSDAGSSHPRPPTLSPDEVRVQDDRVYSCIVDLHRALSEETNSPRTFASHELHGNQEEETENVRRGTALINFILTLLVKRRVPYHEEPFDVVIGSDLLYFSNQEAPLLAAIAHRLSRRREPRPATALVCQTMRRNNRAVWKRFVAAARKTGFHVVDEACGGGNAEGFDGCVGGVSDGGGGCGSGGEGGGREALSAEGEAEATETVETLHAEGYRMLTLTWLPEHLI